MFDDMSDLELNALFFERPKYFFFSDAVIDENLLTPSFHDKFFALCALTLANSASKMFARITHSGVLFSKSKLKSAT